MQPKEHHSKQSGEAIRDIMFGMSDGLTVPFAIAAGLTGGQASSHLILTAGLASIVAGSISMGLGGYLAGRSDVEIYRSEQQKEEREVKEFPEVEAEEVVESLVSYGLTRQEAKPVVTSLKRNREAWVKFMMRNELGLEQPHPKRAMTSALTIATAYAVSGAIPLAPYAIMSDAKQALLPSIVVTLLALLISGYAKGKVTNLNPFLEAVRMAVIGGLAAATAFFLARSF